MSFGAAQWLLAVPLLWVAAWVFPRLELRRPLRAVACGVLVLVLADLQMLSRHPGLDLWVLLDRSDSAAEAVAAGLPEWRAILDKEAGSQDRLHWVEFGAEPVISHDRPADRFEGHTDQSRIGLALRAALSAMDPKRAHRVVVLGDGYGTDGLQDLAPAFTAAGVPIDLRLWMPQLGPDVSVRSLVVPDQVQEGEPVLIEAQLQGNRRGKVAFELRRDDQVVHQGEVELDERGAQVRLVDRPTRAGAHRYTLRLRGPADAVPGNDLQSRWVQVEGGARVLLVTAYRQGPVAQVLSKAGFSVEEITEPSRAQVGRLAGARALIIEDVPAHQLPREFLAAVPFWVQEQGGALWMLGGRHAFGSGGYFESALDPLLPVSMELKQEHRKLAVALAIVLDRSGSMGAQVEAGGRVLTKMDLANDGAARAVELLGDRDQVVVLAVDSEAHLMVPRVALSSARDDVLDSLRRINSMGGGIYVYEGLAAAYKELEAAEVGRRHIILFSDAADSEEPGAYKALLKEMTAAGVTVSVIGLGSKTDTDGALLQDIAERGQGRIFFTESAAELPALFAQETVAVARSVFVTEPAGVAETAGWLEISPRALHWPSIVDAYNLSYARPQATVAARTRDEEAAPLVAFWSRGRGRVAAVCFPMAGEGSEQVRGWDGYGDFTASLVRWLVGEGQPQGVALRRRVQGDTLIVELLHDETWDEVVGRQAPRIAVAGGQGEPVHEATWQRMGPGRWSTVLELPSQGYLRGAVQVGAATLSLGPVSAEGDLEWRRDASAKAELQALSAATGGEQRTRLADVFRAPRPPRSVSLAGPLLILWLLLFVAEALLMQTGFRRIEWAWPRWSGPRRAPRPAAPPAASVAEPEAKVEGPAPTEQELEAQRRRRRLARAKRGR